MRVLRTGGQMDTDVVVAVDGNLAVVADLLAVFAAAVAHGNTEVLAGAGRRVAIEGDFTRVDHIPGGVADQDPRRVTYAFSEGDRSVIGDIA